MLFALLSLCLGFAHSRVRTDLTIDNFQPAEVVRYPLVIVKGAAEGPEMAIGTSWKTANRFPVVNHRYTSAVELKPGRNMLLVHSGPETLKFRLDYKPMINPNKTVAIYICAADDAEAPSTIRARCDIAAKATQCLTAEAMNRAGYGRKTFCLDLQNDGKVNLHIVKSPKTRAELEAMDAISTRTHILEFIRPVSAHQGPEELLFLGFGNLDPATHKSLGLPSLPARSQEGSKTPNWWPETVRDAGNLKWDDLSRWDAFLTARMNYDPQFQPDTHHTDRIGMPPEIRVEGDDLVIEAPNGLRVAGAACDGVPSWFVEYKGAEPPKKVKLSRKDLRAKMGETKQVLHIMVVDDRGRQASIDDRG